jgi:hypothetical protein
MVVFLFNTVIYVFYCYVYIFLCMFMYLHPASWHSSATMLFPQLYGKCQGKTCKDGARPAPFQNVYVLLCIVFVWMCTALLQPGGYPTAVNKYIISYIYIYIYIYISVCNKSVPTGQIFMKFDVPSIFQKSVEKIQFTLNCDKRNRDLAWKRMYIHGIRKV